MSDELTHKLDTSGEWPVATWIIRTNWKDMECETRIIASRYGFGVVEVYGNDPHGIDVCPAFICPGIDLDLFTKCLQEATKWATS